MARHIAWYDPCCMCIVHIIVHCMWHVFMLSRGIDIPHLANMSCDITRKPMLYCFCHDRPVAREGGSLHSIRN